jgi:phosphohistidine phosphatase
LILYILRHGIAEPRREGRSDSARALTPAGKQKLRAVLRMAQKAGVSPSIIVTSPYKRALETTQMAGDVLGCSTKPIVTKALLPSSPPDRLWKELAGIEATSVLVAGHEPQLSHLIVFLLNCPALQIDLKKGALVRVDVSAAEPSPNGVLKWMLTPKLASS